MAKFRFTSVRDIEAKTEEEAHEIFADTSEISMSRPMPSCKNCHHSAYDHEWKRATRMSHCNLYCGCTKYQPDVPYIKPVNKVIGRIRYRRK